MIGPGFKFRHSDGDARPLWEVIDVTRFPREEVNAYLCVVSVDDEFFEDYENLVKVFTEDEVLREERLAAIFKKPDDGKPEPLV